MVCPEHHAIQISTPGAGGYGDPLKRDRRRIAIDWRSGKYSLSFLAAHYGVDAVELEAISFDVDAPDYDNVRPRWREGADE
jgi:N-methylhydantoinase B/oxoprolinase/acetone carboxylase alpha subunit